MLRPEKLAEVLRYILAHSPASPGLPIEVELIANPAAGGFTRLDYARRRSAELDTLAALASALPPREAPVALRLHLTGRAGHATEIAHSVFAEARERGYTPALRILMTAGGDGTSLEAVSALLELAPEERALWLVLRLPLGTGNDGSEGRDLGTCLGRLLGPCSAEPRTAIRLKPAPAGGKAAIWSFNIASVGADAFIAHMTNRMKAIFPGDSYKLMVDLAALTYDFVWPSLPMRVRASGGSGERIIEGDCLLMAVGATGNRQYGSNKRILPGPENVCFIPRVSLLRKFQIKDPISSGKHAEFPEVQLFGADRLVFEYGGPLLCQADGEVVYLEAADFPLEFEIVKGAYTALGAAG